MAYVGNPSTNLFTSMDKQDITGNGGANYTLSHAVANANEIEVFVNNVRQESGVAYTASGTALTMTGNVASSDSFYVVFQGKSVGSIVPADGSVGTAKIADDAVTTAKMSNGTEAYVGYLHCRHQAASGTSGGTGTDGQTAIRNLEDVITNTISGATGGNTITLPAGTYYVSARVPTYSANATHCWLYNTTDSAVALTGSSGYAHAGGNSHCNLTIHGRLTIAASKSFQVQHYIQTGNTYSFGVPISVSGVDEIYSEIEIWKLGD